MSSPSAHSVSAHAATTHSSAPVAQHAVVTPHVQEPAAVITAPPPAPAIPHIPAAHTSMGTPSPLPAASPEAPVQDFSWWIVGVPIAIVAIIAAFIASSKSGNEPASSFSSPTTNGFSGSNFSGSSSGTSNSSTDAPKAS